MGVSPDECVSISADTKDALARDMPQAAHCRSALLAGLALYGATLLAPSSSRIATSIARLFWSLLDDRKSHPIESARGNAPCAPADVRDRAARAAARASAEANAQVRPLDGDSRGFPGLRFARRRSARLPLGVRAGRRPISPRVWHGCSAAPDARQNRRCVKRRDVLYYKDFEAIVERADADRRVRRRAASRRRPRVARDQEPHPSLVNTEAANMERAAAAAADAAADHRIRGQRLRLCELSPALREIAELRLAHPDESLAELGAPLQSADRQAHGQQPLERAEPAGRRACAAAGAR